MATEDPANAEDGGAVIATSDEDGGEEASPKARVAEPETPWSEELLLVDALPLPCPARAPRCFFEVAPADRDTVTRATAAEENRGQDLNA